MRKTTFILTAIFMLGLQCQGQGWVKIGKAHDSSPTDALYADTVDNLLYVGGSFNRFNGSWTDTVTASSIATWNGTQWDTLGEGTNCLGNQCPPVYDIIRFRDKIYACGAFTQMGNVNSSIAAWNGTDWEFVANTPNGYISGFQVIDDTLYIMGGFTEFEGLDVNGIVKYDGTTFSDVKGFGQLSLSSFIVVSDIEHYQGELYVAGSFIGDNGKTHICRFDGTQWVDVGGGVTPDADYLVIDLITYKNELYACGEFELINGEHYGNSIARWDGAQWQDVGGGMAANSKNFEMAIWQDRLIVVRGVANALKTGNFSIWDGNQWCSFVPTDLHQNISANVSTVASFQDTLYIGGGFVWFNEDDKPISIMGKFVGDVADWDTCGTYVLGVDERTAGNAPSISVFPNPAVDRVTVQASQGGIHAVTVFDAYGKRVMHMEPKGATVELNTREWAAGMYLVIAHSDNGVSHTKLIKN